MELIPADGAGYGEYEHGRGRSDAFFVSLGACDTEAWAHWLEANANGFLDWWPLRDDRLTPLGTATFFSDMVTGREKRKHPWYAEIMPPGGQEHECKVLLPLPPASPAVSTSTATGQPRLRRTRTRAILNALRPHLERVRRRSEQRHVRADGLTARERKLMVLLRDGLTNKEIAERLVISTGTIRAHLENIFGKLGIHSRTAAVTGAFGETA